MLIETTVAVSPTAHFDLQRKSRTEHWQVGGDTAVPQRPLRRSDRENSPRPCSPSCARHSFGGRRRVVPKK